jgi:hypothetical protein
MVGGNPVVSAVASPSTRLVDLRLRNTPMIPRIAAVLIWLSLPAVADAAQNLDDAAIELAIRAGQDNKFSMWSAQCKAGVSLSDKRKEGAASWTRGSVHFVGEYQVTLLTSAGRIALLAAEAKRQGQSLVLRNVPEELRMNALHVIVDPVKPGSDSGSGLEVPSPIKGILLRSNSAPASQQVEPSSLDVTDVQWSEGRTIMMTRKPDGGLEKNLFERSRATATMPIESVRSLPPGDLQIVVVTTGYERRCGLAAKERLRLVR